MAKMFAKAKKASMKKLKKIRDLARMAVKPENPEERRMKLKRRTMLVLLNLALLSFSIALICAGVQGRRNLKSVLDRNSDLGLNNTSSVVTEAQPSSVNDVDENNAPGRLESARTDLGAWMLGDPFISLIVIGSLLIAISVTGVVGAVTTNPQVLFGYYGPSFVMVAILIYLGCFCFIFAADERMYSEILETYVSTTAQSAMDQMLLAKTHRALIEGGVLSVLSSVLLVLGLWISSTLMGHEYAAKQMAMSMNILTMVFGAFILYLSIVTSQAHIAGAYAAIIVAIVGAFTVLLSVVGYFGLANNSRFLLVLHSFLLAVLCLLLFIGTILCFVLQSQADAYIQSHWDLVTTKVAHISKEEAYAIVGNHMVLIGVAAIILSVCLLYNLFASILTLYSNWNNWGMKVNSLEADESALQSFVYMRRRSSSQSSGGKRHRTKPKKQQKKRRESSEEDEDDSDFIEVHLSEDEDEEGNSSVVESSSDSDADSEATNKRKESKRSRKQQKQSGKKSSNRTGKDDQDGKRQRTRKGQRKGKQATESDLPAAAVPTQQRDAEHSASELSHSDLEASYKPKPAVSKWAAAVKPETTPASEKANPKTPSKGTAKNNDAERHPGGTVKKTEKGRLLISSLRRANFLRQDHRHALCLEACRPTVFTAQAARSLAGAAATGSSAPPPRLVPPFTEETALAKVKFAEAAWNSRDPERVALAYTPDSQWRNRCEFFSGREEIKAFLRRKWSKELDYRLMKELWCFTENRIAVRFEYEWHDTTGQWWRTHGNELWEFTAEGLMQRRDMSANDYPIEEKDRRYRFER
ncbi:unnamed protein product [Closterium sp. NIES-54]